MKKDMGKDARFREAGERMIAEMTARVEEERKKRDPVQQERIRKELAEIRARIEAKAAKERAEWAAEQEREAREGPPADGKKRRKRQPKLTLWEKLERGPIRPFNVEKFRREVVAKFDAECGVTYDYEAEKKGKIRVSEDGKVTIEGEDNKVSEQENFITAIRKFAMEQRRQKKLEMFPPVKIVDDEYVTIFKMPDELIDEKPRDSADLTEIACIHLYDDPIVPMSIYYNLDVTPKKRRSKNTILGSINGEERTMEDLIRSLDGLEEEAPEDPCMTQEIEDRLRVLAEEYQKIKKELKNARRNS